MLLLALATSDSNTNTPANAGSQVTVQGCLGGSSGKFTLLGLDGTTLQGNDDQLKEHVGHTVAVTGTVDTGNSTTTSAQRTLSVISMEHISEKCSTSTTTDSANPAGAADTAEGAGAATAENSQAGQMSAASSGSPASPSGETTRSSGDFVQQAASVGSDSV